MTGISAEAAAGDTIDVAVDGQVVVGDSDVVGNSAVILKSEVITVAIQVN